MQCKSYGIILTAMIYIGNIKYKLKSDDRELLLILTS